MNWPSLLLDNTAAGPTWSSIFSALASRATAPGTDIEAAISDGDRILADAAWDLWVAWVDDPSCASLRTANRLSGWWGGASTHGKAVLVLDALSLREIPALLAGAHAHGVDPLAVEVSGAGAPTTTDAFAQALGVASRSTLKNGSAPGTFALPGGWTHVFEGIPFEDCPAAIPHTPKVFVWHDLVDARLHLVKAQSVLKQQVTPLLMGDGLWTLINALRQGRDLVVTSDHGYAGKARSAAILGSTGKAVSDLLHGSRSVKISQVAPPTLPPLVLTTAEHHCLIGNRSWSVQGGFPELSHGGLSLLEVAVPYVTFGAI